MLLHSLPFNRKKTRPRSSNSLKTGDDIITNAFTHAHMYIYCSSRGVDL